MSGERTLVERLRQQAINRSTLTGDGSHEVMPEWLAADEIISLRHLVEALRKERDAIADFAVWLARIDCTREDILWAVHNQAGNT